MWCASRVLALMTTMHRAAWLLAACPPHSPGHGLLLWSNSVVLNRTFFEVTMVACYSSGQTKTLVTAYRSWPAKDYEKHESWTIGLLGYLCYFGQLSLTCKQSCTIHMASEVCLFCSQSWTLCLPTACPNNFRKWAQTWMDVCDIMMNIWFKILKLFSIFKNIYLVQR